MTSMGKSSLLLTRMLPAWASRMMAPVGLVVLEFDAFHEGLGGPDDAVATGVARDADHAGLDAGEGGAVILEALEVLSR
jgi:hypothetical protein